MTHITPVATPLFNDDDEGGAAFLAALFAPRTYHPAAALAAAQAQLPPDLQTDPYWLSLLLICTAGKLDWMLRYVNLTTQKIQFDRIERQLGLLSGGEWFLAILALHLFNDNFKLPADGLTNLRLLDDYHFEIALHAIRLHSRGLAAPPTALCRNE